jgi:hypothetical protein
VYLGHFGLAMGAKRVAPGPSLGTALFAALVVVRAVLFLASVFGPPPPNVEAVAITGILGWLFVGWGYWIDRHRTLALPSRG